MELFEPLAEFYETIADDGRISATHISLYIALLQQWNLKSQKQRNLQISKTFP